MSGLEINTLIRNKTNSGNIKAIQRELWFGVWARTHYAREWAFALIAKLDRDVDREFAFHRELTYASQLDFASLERDAALFSELERDLDRASGTASATADSRASALGRARALAVALARSDDLARILDPHAVDLIRVLAAKLASNLDVDCDVDRAEELLRIPNTETRG